MKRPGEWWRARSLRSRLLLLLLGIALLAYAFCLPSPLFQDPLSIVLEDREGELLGARIAEDGQWRFPAVEEVPDKYQQAVVTFEDKHFYRHPGVDPLSILRAIGQNVKAGRIVSGGSTISMQVIRLSRKGRPRTIGEKIIEIILATRLELKYSKEEILKLYASHAPFGGNVVGIEAASWRYYGKKPELLSWAEAATLAVLPNSPSLIRPGRNAKRLKEKRDRLLVRMSERGLIDSLSCRLALTESLPGPPLALPQIAAHLLDHFLTSSSSDQPRHRFRSTLTSQLQRAATEIVDRHHQQLKRNQIHNCAALILDMERKEVIAYIGNAPNAGQEHGEQVDIIQARRSTGSILKPFLYTLAVQEGSILPGSLLPDVPTFISGFRPENYHQEFDGAVAADEALIRSLNVPFVHLLRKYGLEKFHFTLKKLGMTSLVYPPSHYGLSLILGGAEASLWDITSIYAGMATCLRHYVQHDARYFPSDFEAPSLLLPEKKRPKSRRSGFQAAPLDAGAIWHTFEAMRQLERPNSEGEWERFQSAFPVAWKTGTSFGFRDAWAIGVTPRYVVGVWAGNADGEGRPGLVGVRAAAPLLFELFDLLPTQGKWFEPPYDALQKVAVCRESGERGSPLCPVDSLRIPEGGLIAPLCTYHQWIFLDSSRQWQVNKQCAAGEFIQRVPWFFLPPAQAFYYRSHHPQYRNPPPWRQDCMNKNQYEANRMQLVYPNNVRRIILPVDLDGEEEKVVFRAAHSNPEALIYWHLDDQFLGTTEQFHELELAPSSGEHMLTLIDQEGFRLEQTFELVRKKE
jgi:penicillin-binding protein 1C